MHVHSNSCVYWFTYKVSGRPNRERKVSSQCILHTGQVVILVKSVFRGLLEEFKASNLLALIWQSMVCTKPWVSVSCYLSLCIRIMLLCQLTYTVYWTSGKGQPFSRFCPLQGRLPFELVFSFSQERVQYHSCMRSVHTYMCAVHFVVIKCNTKKTQNVEIAVQPSLSHDVPLHVYMCMLMELLSTYFVFIDLLHAHVHVCLLYSLQSVILIETTTVEGVAAVQQF